MLPDDEPLSRLIIYTDGMDMIVVEKGKYFSAITKQQYFRFDTEQLKAEITKLLRMDEPIQPSQSVSHGDTYPLSNQRKEEKRSMMG